MKNVIIVAIVALIGYVLIFNHYKSEVKRKENQIFALSDALKLFKNKDGKNVAEITILEGTRKELLSILKTKDHHIHELLKKEKSAKGITNHKVQTKIDTMVKIDTLKLPTDTQSLYAKKTIINDYYRAEMEIKGDSLNLGLTTYNEFDYILKDQTPKGILGFLKPKTYVVQAINLNPHSQTTHLRSIEVKSKNKNGLNLGLGVAIGFGLFYLIK